jgi:hypothetical protein
MEAVHSGVSSVQVRTTVLWLVPEADGLDNFRPAKWKFRLIFGLSEFFSAAAAHKHFGGGGGLNSA